MIYAFIITMEGNEYSEKLSQRVKDSITKHHCNILPHKFRATTPETLEEDWANLKYVSDAKWTWPVSASQNAIDLSTGLYKSAYNAADIRKKQACSLSHIRLWEKCKEEDIPIMVLEHDAVFIQHFDMITIEDQDWGCVGLNDPRGATRRSSTFYQVATKKGTHGVYPVPKVNVIGDPAYPQGLAGNSAYILRPFAASELLDLIKKHGIWPNDAQMCRELCPWLRITQPFYTMVRQTMSTTVL